MANLTKRDLVIAISEKTGLIQQDVFSVVQLTLDGITEALANGQAWSCASSEFSGQL